MIPCKKQAKPKQDTFPIITTQKFYIGHYVFYFDHGVGKIFEPKKKKKKNRPSKALEFQGSQFMPACHKTRNSPFQQA
jgi:hypothetical protein